VVAHTGTGKPPCTAPNLTRESPCPVISLQNQYSQSPGNRASKPGTLLAKERVRQGLPGTGPLLAQEYLGSDWTTKPNGPSPQNAVSEALLAERPEAVLNKPKRAEPARRVLGAAGKRAYRGCIANAAFGFGSTAKGRGLPPDGRKGSRWTVHTALGRFGTSWWQEDVCILGKSVRDENIVASRKRAAVLSRANWNEVWNVSFGRTR